MFMQKINFEYTGVLYYYFIITKENSISNYEFKGLLDFVMDYLKKDKEYASRNDVEFLFEFDLASISSKFAALPYMWCGDLETRWINHQYSPENFHIGYTNLEELKDNKEILLLTSNESAINHLKEAVVAYTLYQKELEKEATIFEEETPKALIKNIFSKIQIKNTI